MGPVGAFPARFREDEAPNGTAAKSGGSGLLLEGLD